MTERVRPSFLSLDACPICSGNAEPLAYSVRAYVEVFAAPIESRLSYCPDCDYVYVANPLDSPSMELYYHGCTRFLDTELVPADVEHIAGQVEFVARALRISGPCRILEIGPFDNRFLRAMLVKCPGVEVSFIEQNASARQRLLDEGFAEYQAGSSDKFDVVVMRHVLEHIIDPVKYLFELRGKLNSGGYVFVEVPDHSNVALGNMDRPQFEHVSYFTLRSMIALADQAGFWIEAMESTQTPGNKTSPNRVLRARLRPLPNNRAATLPEYFESSLSGISQLIERLAGGAKDWGIFGAGGVTQHLLPRLPEHLRPSLIFDNDPNKQGRLLAGIPVVDPGELLVRAPRRLLVTVIGHEAQVMQQLAEILPGNTDVEIIRASEFGLMGNVVP